MQIIDKIEKQQLETTNRDNINDGIELTKSPHPHHHSHHSTTGNNHNESRLKRELLERKPLKLYLPNDNINVLGVKGFNRNSRVDCWSTIVANSLTEQSLHNTRQPSASSSSPSTSSSSAISLSCRECQMELIDCDECCSFCLAIELYKKKFCDECNRNDPDNSQRISASSDLNDDFILDEDCLANFKMSPSISMMNEKNDETRDKIGSLLHRIGKRFKWNSWWWNTRSSKLNGTYLLKRLRAGSQRLRGSKRFRASRKQKFQLNSTKNLPREGNETNDNLQKHNQRTKILRSRLHNDDEIMIDNVDDYRRQQNRKCFLNEKSVEENDIKTHHHNRNDFDGKFKLTNGTDVLDEKKQNKTMNNVDRHQNNLNGICKSDLIATAINKKEIASIINDKRIDDIQRNENCFDRKRLAQTNSSDKIRLFESSYSNVENGPECLKGKIDSIKPFFLSHPDRNEAKKFNDTKILEIGIQGISISSDSGKQLLNKEFRSSLILL
ncbi:hypothetical protein QR98_0019060 [Sarcoptes scabiei]|uniref:Uncharacterized protein n=1 Tax=Sarcoptes scabiei TaxID=52283 RepID=A0A131ZXQ4_SARSC|nr:hypothetical protein QR98_0019060 [Sarcoptes scabiei]